jgi:hypothetical protein
VTYKIVQTDLSGESKCWIAQNLGASRQAMTESDFSEESAGWYWQFNRKQGYKHDGMDRTPNSAWQSVVENSNWLSANDPCISLIGNGWRLPTNTELEILTAQVRANNLNLFNTILRIHKAGRLMWNGTLNNRGTEGQVHSLNQNGDHKSFKILWSITDIDGVNNDRAEKTLAASVRCLKD